MTRYRTGTTLSGIAITAFAKPPTAGELGDVVAQMSVDDQARFFGAFYERLHFASSIQGLPVHLQSVADAIAKEEEEFCSGCASALFDKMHALLAAKVSS